MKKAALVLLLMCLCSTLQGYIRLNEVMTAEEQKMTGVDKLSAKQRAALQMWLNKKFDLKEVPTEYANLKIYVIENYNSGTRLLMSNHKTYEVAPEDRGQAEFWLSPFPISIESSTNPDYPLKMINTSIGTGIAVRELTSEEVREFEEEERVKRQNRQLEEELKALQAPPPEAHDHDHPHPHPSPVETAPTSAAPEFEIPIISNSPPLQLEEWEDEVILDSISEQDPQ